LGELFLEKMEIGKSFFGEKHAKLSHLKILAPKIIYAKHKFKCGEGSLEEANP